MTFHYYAVIPKPAGASSHTKRYCQHINLDGTICGAKIRGKAFSQRLPENQVSLCKTHLLHQGHRNGGA